MNTMLIVPLFIGTTELLLIGGLALLLFGGKKLPEMMRGLGQGIKSFKSGMNDTDSNDSGKENKKPEGNNKSDENNKSEENKSSGENKPTEDNPSEKK